MGWAGRQEGEAVGEGRRGRLEREAAGVGWLLLSPAVGCAGSCVRPRLHGQHDTGHILVSQNLKEAQ